MNYLIIIVLVLATISNAYQENSKFLGQDYEEERRLGNRRRKPSSQGSNPCNFGGSGGYRNPKNQGSGRTFFDLQFFNVEHNYNLEINCGGNGGSYPSYPAHVTEIHNEGGGYKPPLHGIGNGGHRPMKPLFGGNHKPNKPNKPGGGFFQSLFGGGNRPNDDLSGDNGQGIKPFAGFFPSPHQFATGLSEGLQGFIGTLPDIGQSFQSILPSFDNFQWPQLPQFSNFQRPQALQPNPGGGGGPVQFGPVFPGGGGSVPSNPFNGPSSFSTPTSFVSTTPSFITASTPTTTTVDPDDIIYSDEIKPVHEDYDPITDPYSNRPSGSLPPGQYLSISNPHLGSYTQDISIFNPTNIHKTWTHGVKEVLEELGANGKFRPNSYYSKLTNNQYRNYRGPSYPPQSRNENYQTHSRSNSLSRGRPEGRTFSFPS